MKTGSKTTTLEGMKNKEVSGNLSTSDVIRFISVQPDFYEFSAAPEEIVG